MTRAPTQAHSVGDSQNRPDIYFGVRRYSLTYSSTPNHTSGRQQESMTIPKAAHSVLWAPDDGRKNHPKHVERW
jgi:hypothetical protein